MNPKTLLLFDYDWDASGYARLAPAWPQESRGFDLFSFPSNARLAGFAGQDQRPLALRKSLVALPLAHQHHGFQRRQARQALWERYRACASISARGRAEIDLFSARATAKGRRQ